MLDVGNASYASAFLERKLARHTFFPCLRQCYTFKVLCLENCCAKDLHWYYSVIVSHPLIYVVI